MPSSLAGLSPEAVIDVIESNLVDSSTTLGRTEDGVIYRGSDVTWVYTGQPQLNRVLRARFTSEDVSDRVAEVLSFFRQWDASVSWVVGPSSYPPRLSERLHENGFGNSDVWSGMAMALDGLADTIQQPPGAVAKQVTDAQGLSDWNSLQVNSVIESKVEAAQVAGIFTPENAGGDRRCRYYVGYIDSTPVSRVMSFTSGEVVGLYWLNTAVAYRERGFCTWLSHYALTQAKELGSKLSVVTVPTPAIKMCEGLGYRTYCQFHVYAWPPNPLRMPVC